MTLLRKQDLDFINIGDDNGNIYLNDINPISAKFGE